MNIGKHNYILMNRLKKVDQTKNSSAMLASLKSLHDKLRQHHRHAFKLIIKTAIYPYFLFMNYGNLWAF